MLPPARLTGNRNEFVLDGRKELTSDAYMRCSEGGFYGSTDCNVPIDSLKKGNRHGFSEEAQLIEGAISAGVFIALYLAVYVIIGVACMPVPILFLLMPELVALVAAPVYHTMLSKSPSGTPIFIAAILPSLILIASGHIPIAPLVSVPVGIAAVLIARKGQYKSFKWNAASHAVFSWNLLGGFVPIWFMRDYFFQDTFERGMSADFCDTLYALTPDWVFLAMMLAIVVFSLAGSLIARKLLAGRLESAGIL